MASVVVVKGEDGKLTGLGEKAGKAWTSFMRWVADMAPGDTLQFEWNKPRSLQHHRHFFAMLHALLDRQEQFESMDQLRMWLTVGAGHCAFVPGPDGAMVALPDSIAFHRLDEVEFSAFRAAVERFLWTPHAQGFLWPHLGRAQRYAAVESLLGEFR
jgi:hypothetical protein